MTAIDTRQDAAATPTGLAGVPTVPRHTLHATHGVAAGDPSATVPRHSRLETQGRAAGDGLGWLELRTFAEMYADQMAARIASTNRALRGDVDPTVYADALRHLDIAEHEIEKAMWKCYRRVVPPELIAWQKTERGVGEHLLARLLGHLGDPYIATPAYWVAEPPDGHICDPLRCGDGTKRHLVAGTPFVRTISQLWSYCGHGDATRKPFKGMSADAAMAMGNPTNKMLLHLIAEKAMMQKANPGRYRVVYEDRRAATTDHVHAVECRRCGPSGKPALVGSPWSLAHQLADALRIVGKEMLRDMWLARHQATHP